MDGFSMARLAELELLTDPESHGEEIYHFDFYEEQRSHEALKSLKSMHFPLRFDPDYS